MHALGVLHLDIKPSNIGLIKEERTAREARLNDRDMSELETAGKKGHVG
jgi:serine/threonine protein kinase